MGFSEFSKVINRRRLWLFGRSWWQATNAGGVFFTTGRVIYDWMRRRQMRNGSPGDNASAPNGSLLLYSVLHFICIFLTSFDYLCNPLADLFFFFSSFFFVSLVSWLLHLLIPWKYKQYPSYSNKIAE